jgi:hypothetical protein
MPIRATGLPLNFMGNGSHLLKTPQRRVEMIAVESLPQDPLDLAFEFITVRGTGTEFGQDQNFDIHERFLLSLS